MLFLVHDVWQRLRVRRSSDSLKYLLPVSFFLVSVFAIPSFIAAVPPPPFHGSHHAVITADCNWKQALCFYQDESLFPLIHVELLTLLTQLTLLTLLTLLTQLTNTHLTCKTFARKLKENKSSSVTA